MILGYLMTLLCGGELLAADRIEARTFRSEALGRDVPYSVFIPSEPAPAGGWPLVLVLHGAGRNHRTPADTPETRAEILTRKLVLVFADGKLGWWFDSEAEPASKYDSMLQELLRLVRRDLPVSSAPARTGVCGWSMGGYGSVRFAETHPEELGAVATAIALLDFPNPALPREQTYRMSPVFGTDPEQWRRLNCMTDAERLRGRQLLFIAGRRAFDYQMNLNFHQRLEGLGIPHELREIDGGHTFPAVQAAWPQMLDFMESRLGADGPAR
jgi:S-formylglutathione hydrolase FrmB